MRNTAAEIANLGMERRKLVHQLEQCDEQALVLMKELRPSWSLRELGLAYGISYQTVKSWINHGIVRRPPPNNES